MLNKALFWQLCRFGIVGVSAAILHFSIVKLLVELASLHPLNANVIAFLCAFNVSYLGHRHWTFHVTVHTATSIQRFFLVASLSFVLNEGLYFILLEKVGLGYSIALVMVLSVVPVFTFIFSKLWAFRPMPANG